MAVLIEIITKTNEYASDESGNMKIREEKVLVDQCITPVLVVFEGIFGVEYRDNRITKHQVLSLDSSPWIKSVSSIHCR